MFLRKIVIERTSLHKETFPGIRQLWPSGHSDYWGMEARLKGYEEEPTPSSTDLRMAHILENEVWPPHPAPYLRGTS